MQVIPTPSVTSSNLTHLWGTNQIRAAIRSNQDLRRELEMNSTRRLVYAGRNKSNHYTILTIPKRDGTRRILHNPDQVMRSIQYRILTKLLNKLQLPDYVYAFERDRNIPTMASLHTNKHCVISLDIKNFFHSIMQEKLADIFCRLGIESIPSRTLSELCTYKAFVPQGAITSPKISNLVTSVTFGPEIKAYCVEKNLTLTIYADDVTISTNDKEINPKEIIQRITQIIQSHGFKVNRKKTKVMFHGNRQYVCGAVVNSKVNLIVKERKKLRAMVHNVVNNGIAPEADKSGLQPSTFLNRLRGRINWYRQLNPILGQKLFDKLKAYLIEIKEKAAKEAEIATLYAAYMQEIDNAIREEPVLDLPF